MNTDLSILLGNISGYTVLLPLLVGMLGFKRHTRVQRQLFWLVVLSALTEAAIRVIMHYDLTDNNLPGLHAFTLAQLLFLLFIYREHILRWLGEKMFWFLVYGSILFALVNAFWIDGLFNQNTTFRAYECVVMLAIIFNYFYRLLVDLSSSNLEKEPLFWISAAMTIYFSGNFLVFLVSSTLQDQRSAFWTIYLIHSALLFLMNVFYTIALWVNPPR